MTGPYAAIEPGQRRGFAFLSRPEAWSRWRRGLARHLAGLVIALISVGLLTWLIERIGLSQVVDNLAMLYLVIVVGSAAFFGRVVAAVTSFAGVLSYHLTFVRPYGEISFGRPSDILAVTVFLLVGMVIGQLAAALRERAAEAQVREGEALALFRLTRAIASVTEAAAIQQAVVDQSLATFGASRVRLVIGGGSRAALTLAQSGDLAAAPERWSEADWPEPALSREDDAIVLSPSPDGGRGRIALDQEGALILTWNRAGLTKLPDPSARIWRGFRDQARLALERARFTEEARQQERQRQKEAFQSTLLATVSHDFRTPLAAIKALAGSLRSAASPDDVHLRGEMIDAIERETDRLHRLVSNLLDLSRLQAGALIPNKDWYLIDELVREVVDRFSVRVPAPVAIDAGSGAVPVPVDDVHFDQILTNLLENAARVSPPGIPVEVRISTEPGAVRIAVEDRGPGIARADLPHLFESFYQGQSRLGHGGSGLGLAICRGLVEAHGGQIWAESRAGGGARFSFSLPAPPGLPAEREDCEEEA